MRKTQGGREGRGIGMPPINQTRNESLDQEALNQVEVIRNFDKDAFQNECTNSSKKKSVNYTALQITGRRQPPTEARDVSFPTERQLHHS